MGMFLELPRRQREEREERDREGKRVGSWGWKIRRQSRAGEH